MLKNGQLHTTKCIYYPTILLHQIKCLDQILTILLQAIPAYFLDFFNTDKRVRLIAVSRKLQSMRNVIAFFLSKRFKFTTDNIERKVFNKYEMKFYTVKFQLMQFLKKKKKIFQNVRR